MQCIFIHYKAIKRLLFKMILNAEQPTGGKNSNSRLGLNICFFAYTVPYDKNKEN